MSLKTLEGLLLKIHIVNLIYINKLDKFNSKDLERFLFWIALNISLSYRPTLVESKLKVRTDELWVYLCEEEDSQI